MKNIISDIEKEINAEVSRIQQSLGDGVCEDYNHYKQQVGCIIGLKYANSLITNIYRKMIDGEDDADY